jgi:hypothetical protein
MDDPQVKTDKLRKAIPGRNNYNNWNCEVTAK